MFLLAFLGWDIKWRQWQQIYLASFTSTFRQSKHHLISIWELCYRLRLHPCISLRKIGFRSVCLGMPGGLTSDSRMNTCWRVSLPHTSMFIPLTALYLSFLALTFLKCLRLWQNMQKINFTIQIIAFKWGIERDKIHAYHPEPSAASLFRSGSTFQKANSYPLGFHSPSPLALQTICAVSVLNVSNLIDYVIKLESFNVCPFLNRL